MFSSIHLVLAAIIAWLAIGVLAIAWPRSTLGIGRVLFVAGALVGLALAVVALLALGQEPQALVLPLGLPDLPFHLRLDSLSALFLLLLGAAASGIS
ncbi:MAG: hydrogenase 4 subunit B, partial [Casimicrobiaceae bacterium]